MIKLNSFQITAIMKSEFKYLKSDKKQKFGKWLRVLYDIELTLNILYRLYSFPSRLKIVHSSFNQSKVRDLFSNDN